MNGDETAFAGCGLSRQKRAYVKDLAEHFATNQIPTRKLAAMDDDDVIDALVKVNGIGRWTAEMFLIFTLNRPDVLPVDDLGLRQGAQRVFRLRKTPDGKKLTKLAEPWRPYRSIATWYIWSREREDDGAGETRESDDEVTEWNHSPRSRSSPSSTSTSSARTTQSAPWPSRAEPLAAAAAPESMRRTWRRRTSS
jgi:hypothetical protein